MVSAPGFISNSYRAGDNAMLPSVVGPDWPAMEVERNSNIKRVFFRIVMISREECQQGNPEVDEIVNVKVLLPVLAA